MRKSSVLEKGNYDGECHKFKQHTIFVEAVASDQTQNSQ